MPENETKEEFNFSKYDFDRPDKFSFENLRSFDSILSVFARNFATELSGLLRMPAEIEIKKVEQVPFGTEFIEKRDRDEFIFVVTNLDGNEQIIVQFDVGFLLSVHSKQGGGSFGKINRGVKKNITEFEKITVEHLVNEYLYPPLKDAFKDVWSFDYSIDRIETDPQYSKVTLPSDMAALISLDVQVGNEYTEVQLVIPYLSVELYIESLNTDNVLKNRRVETSKEQLFFLEDHLKQVVNNFEVELGAISLNLKDIYDLKVGDVLVLDQLIKPATVYYGGKKKYLGRIGSSNGRSAVKLVGLIREQGIKEKIQQELTKDTTP